MPEVWTEIRVAPGSTGAIVGVAGDSLDASLGNRRNLRPTLMLSSSFPAIDLSAQLWTGR